MSLSGVGGGEAGEQDVAALHLGLGSQPGELAGVDQVAVVPEGDPTVAGVPKGRLGVLPVARAGGGVAGVADGEVAVEGGQVALVEDLGDQAHVLVDHDAVAVADRDPGGLLAAVLQGVEPEVGELGDLFAGRPDAEDAAGVLRALLAGLTGKEIVGEPTVTALHPPSLGDRSRHAQSHTARDLPAASPGAGAASVRRRGAVHLGRDRVRTAAKASLRGSMSSKCAQSQLGDLWSVG